MHLHDFYWWIWRSNYGFAGISTCFGWKLNGTDRRETENKNENKSEIRFLLMYSVYSVRCKIKRWKTLYSFEKNGKGMNEPERKKIERNELFTFIKNVSFETTTPPQKQHHIKAESLLFELFEWMFFVCPFKFFFAIFHVVYFAHKLEYVIWVYRNSKFCLCIRKRCLSSESRAFDISPICRQERKNRLNRNDSNVVHCE